MKQVNTAMLKQSQLTASSEDSGWSRSAGLLLRRFDQGEAAAYEAALKAIGKKNRGGLGGGNHAAEDSRKEASACLEHANE